MLLNRILVVSDRFPPETAGGAEISLELVLSRLHARRARVTVVTLSEHRFDLGRTEFGGIPVYHVPFSPLWPREAWFWRTLGERKPRSLWKPAWKAWGACMYLARRGRVPRGDRLRRLLLKVKLDRHGHGRYFPFMDDEIGSVRRTAQAFRRVVEETRPDLVHADNYRSIVLTASMCPEGLPFTVAIRDNRFYCAERNQAAHVGGRLCTSCDLECTAQLPERVGAAVRRYMRTDMETRLRCLRRANGVIVTSCYLRRQAQEIVPADRIHVVPNPAGNPEAAMRIQRNIRRADPPEILVVGMLNENKGQIETIRWLERLSKKLADFRIVIAGRGPNMQRKLVDAAKRRGLLDRLVMLGYLSREELLRAYARSTVVACPNVWPEPFGRVPLEAGLSCRPVVAYASGGVAENVIHGRTGLLVPPGDKEGFTDRLAWVIKDRRLAQRLGKEAQKYVAQKFGVEQAAAGLADVWAKVLEEEPLHDSAVVNTDGAVNRAANAAEEIA